MFFKISCILPYKPKPMKKIVTLVALVLSFSAFAQRNCGTMEHYERAVQENPFYEENLQNIENFTNDFLTHYTGEDRAVVTIPVVVHVVYSTAAMNVSDAQIQSQITVMNNDFRKLNADVANTPSVFAGLAADAQVQFCLASVDPNGNATTGITRTSTTVSAFSTNDAVKYASSGGKDAWPASSYLNLWVCDISGGILGYAQFPGGSAATDGVVIDYQYFGTIGTATAPFNLGRTATHEVGHWLNLRHIWGDANCGSDLVSDTPTHNTANYGCPTYPHYSTCTGAPVEMTMNYMDYTDDACMYMFSAGQSARMQALFATGGARASLLTSNGCGTPAPVLCGVPANLASSAVSATGATVSWGAVTGVLSYTLQYKSTTATTWTTVSGLTATSYVITGLTSGTTYSYQVNATCSAGTGNYSSAGSFTTTSTTTTCTDSYETNNSSSQAKAITANTNITAKISSTSDVDWFKFTTTTAAKNIRIDLTNLPADYDVRLYNPSGTQIGISQNGGTTAEAIIYNNGAAGTYKVKVYGYAGANSTSCYTLRASTSATAFREGDEAPISFESEIVNEASLANLTIYPNPVTSSFQVQFTSNRSEQVYVQVYDATGRMVDELGFVSTSGLNFVTLNSDKYRSGYYHLLIINANERISSALIKE